MCDITSDLLSYRGSFYTKLLYMKKDFAIYLKDFSDNIIISANDEKRVFESTKEAFQIYKTDRFMSDLYSVITRENSKRYFDKIF